MQRRFMFVCMERGGPGQGPARGRGGGAKCIPVGWGGGDTEEMREGKIRA